MGEVEESLPDITSDDADSADNVGLTSANSTGNGVEQQSNAMADDANSANNAGLVPPNSTENGVEQQSNAMSDDANADSANNAELVPPNSAENGVEEKSNAFANDANAEDNAALIPPNVLKETSNTIPVIVADSPNNAETSNNRDETEGNADAMSDDADSKNNAALVPPNGNGNGVEENFNAMPNDPDSKNNVAETSDNQDEPEAKSNATPNDADSKNNATPVPPPNITEDIAEKSGANPVDTDSANNRDDTERNFNALPNDAHSENDVEGASPNSTENSADAEEKSNAVPDDADPQKHTVETSSNNTGNEIEEKSNAGVAPPNSTENSAEENSNAILEVGDSENHTGETPSNNNGNVTEENYNAGVAPPKSTENSAEEKKSSAMLDNADSKNRTRKISFNIENETEENSVEQITIPQNLPPPKPSAIHPDGGVKKSVAKLSSLVGNTPLIPLSKILQPHKYTCQVYAKCEFRNPSGSSWDRLVVNTFQEMQKSGELYPSKYFVTGGSPDLCTSLAWAGSSGDFRMSVLPGENSVNDESKNLLLKGFGANLILSYGQDPFRDNTRTCLETHIKQLETTSGIIHHNILPFPTEKSVKVYAESIEEEIEYQIKDLTDDTDADEKPKFDLIVCAGDNKSLLYGLVQSFERDPLKGPLIVGVDLKHNCFSEDLNVENEIDQMHKSVIWTTVTDAEAMDMTRRLIREEGLPVGPASGAVIVALMTACTAYGIATNPDAKVLVILGDSLLQAPSLDFLSTEWMVARGYYDPKILESLLWWYEMALENINPPVVLAVPPDAPVNIVWTAMGSSSVERAVVVENTNEGMSKTVIGIVTYEDLTARMNSGFEERFIIDACHTEFGLIDSKQSLADLEALLRKYHWVVKIHRITVYGNEKDSPTSSEDVIGVINTADFMKYKRSIEAHHQREYGVSMSDGIPSEVWLEKFNKLEPVQTAAKEEPEPTSGSEDENQNSVEMNSLTYNDHEY